MTHSIFASPSWYRAMTLSERIAIFSGNGRILPDSDIDEELGKKRFQSWQSQPQFETESIFSERLAKEGINESRLQEILSLTEDQLFKHLPQQPEWLAAIEKAFSKPASSYVNLQPGEEELGFLELVQPLVDRACDRLFDGVEELLNKWPIFPFDPQTIEDILLMNLLDPLLLRLSRTMVLELNVARLQGYLAGETPAERFISFIERLRQQEETLAILAEYPVLARQLEICIDQWQEVSLEFLGRLCADWQAICTHFDLHEDPGPLVELVGGAGDTHRGGRSVMIARFESGFQIVYKPKSMAVDIHFQELLAWINERGCEPPLRTMTILDRVEYGWVEYVQNEECHSVAEIKRFYQRLGAYLALLYAINASDFHLENLIASGEHPILIDLETLFNPEFERFEENSEAYAVASGTMMQSVLVVGMLPQRLWSAGDYGGIDISGLGGEEGQLSPDRIPRAAAAGTDEMRFERERIALEGESNRPRLHGSEASALDYIPDVLSGFKAMYQLLLNNRDGLLDNSGPLAKFDQDETRVLLRPTRTYDQLLFESFHPDTLRDALDRGMLLDRLWMVVPQRSFMAPVIKAEEEDLLQGDIPVFTTTPDSLLLYSASGEAIEGVLTETGMAITRRRIQQLSNQDLKRQEWIIRSSLATLAPYKFGSEFQDNGQFHLPEAEKKPTYEQLTTAVRAAADQLLETAVLGEDDVTWLGIELLAEQSWDVTPAGMDLYNGVPGIALFLAYAGSILNEGQYTNLARRAANGILRHVELFSAELPGVGGFEGWGGILYTITHLARLWQDETLFAQTAQLVDVVARFIEEEEDYSVVSGAAGAVASLLALYHCQPSAKTLETAVACGDHILAAAQPMEEGLGWVTERFGPQAQVGFAYGAGGIAWALLELTAVSGEERFAKAAAQAITYERSRFSTEEQNWPDLRQFVRENGEIETLTPRYPAAWCFGAAGIGLARLQVRPHLDDPKIDEEINIALNTTLTQGFGHSHCLCHGDLGNLELLIEANQKPGFSKKPGFSSEIDKISATILRKHQPKRLAKRRPQRRPNARPHARHRRHRLPTPAPRRTRPHPIHPTPRPTTTPVGQDCILSPA